MVNKWKKADDEYTKRLKLADAEVAKTDRTGWYNRTGWPEYIAKRNMAYLAHARRLPDRDEKELKQVCSVIDSLMERCVSGLSTLAHEIRRWLKSAKRKEINIRPIGRLQNIKSQTRYAGYLKLFVCYCLRLVAVEEAEGARGEDTDDSNNDGSENLNGGTRNREENRNYSNNGNSDD